jgi:hypothetical protein
MDTEVLVAIVDCICNLLVRVIEGGRAAEGVGRRRHLVPGVVGEGGSATGVHHLSPVAQGVQRVGEGGERRASLRTPSRLLSRPLKQFVRPEHLSIQQLPKISSRREAGSNFAGFWTQMLTISLLAPRLNVTISSQQVKVLSTPMLEKTKVAESVTLS